MDSWILRKRFADETDSEAEPEASGIAGEDVPSSSVSAVSVFSSPAASQGLVAGLRRSARVAATQASPAAPPGLLSPSSSIPLSLGESEDEDIEEEDWIQTRDDRHSSDSGKFIYYCLAWLTESLFVGHIVAKTWRDSCFQNSRTMTVS